MNRKGYLDGKIILVTGGTGTFGRAFVARILKNKKVVKVIVLSRDEFKQNEMSRDFQDKRLNFFLGDVRDLSRLERAFSGVDVVIHAAALKQVPATEYNPLEAVKTNINGTQNVVDAALNRGVDKVLFVSSDKAVEPINLYGATKLVAERLTVASNAYRGQGNTKLSVVRYGNVIGSRGSVIELVEKQRATGSVTLTDERMTRFWIHIQDVMEIVINILDCMEGGEIFIPKMKSLRVVDVLKTLAPECKLNVIGIRPGEKLHEKLLTKHESGRTRDLDTMFAILPEFVSWATKDSFRKKKPFPVESIYSSDSGDFLLPAKEVNKILKI
ncbi:MAG: UDP-N-acetylglucosamine 4,6-dehydratase (inverting) [Candidatus Yonathbacteria bacterium]|nr:UDP-N-acetylglucosamine 4,6-dehydratase (inverting) [Candidatus Yonathbacteria bacterium]